MNIITNKYKGIFYKYIKNNKKDTIVLLHGFTGDSSIWDVYVKKFVRGHNLLLIDLLGHGESNTPKHIEEYNFDNQTKIISEILIRECVNTGVIVGYSYSAHLCFSIYLKIPKRIKSLIFISPYFRTKRFYDSSLKFFLKFFWELLIPNKKYKLDYSKIKNYEKPTLKDNKYILKSINTKDLFGSLYSFSKISEIPDFNLINKPILLIYGKNDRMFNKLDKGLMENKTIKTESIKNKEHLFLKTKSKIVSSMILNFLKS